MAVDKELAIKLREQGKSYQEISDSLKCSLDWCKRNLKNVTKDVKSMSLFDECTTLAKGINGITREEIITLVKKHYPELTEFDDVDAEYRRIRRKLKATKDCLFRPSWMVPNAAQESMQAILRAVNVLESRFQEEIDDILSNLGLDDSMRKTVVYSVITMLSAGYHIGHDDIESICSRLQDSIDVLEKRQTQTNLVKTTNPNNVVFTEPLPY